jgi:redox-sensing transcriptional repressor
LQRLQQLTNPNSEVDLSTSTVQSPAPQECEAGLFSWSLGKKSIPAGVAPSMRYSDIMTESNPHSELRLSRAAAQRLSLYLRSLDSFARTGTTLSSEVLAKTVGVSAAQVRRDLAMLGHLGLRGIGYEAAGLAAAIRKTLGIDRPWKAVLVGVGNLARALLRYRGFSEHGFEIVGLFDSDSTKIGQIVGGLSIEPLSRLKESVQVSKAELGILTVPSDVAQAVANQMVEAGLRGVMNFASVLLVLPHGVQVVTVDLAIQLEQLAFAVHLGED